MGVREAKEKGKTKKKKLHEKNRTSLIVGSFFQSFRKHILSSICQTLFIGHATREKSFLFSGSLHSSDLCDVILYYIIYYIINYAM